MWTSTRVALVGKLTLKTKTVVAIMVVMLSARLFRLLFFHLSLICSHELAWASGAPQVGRSNKHHLGPLVPS